MNSTTSTIQDEKHDASEAPNSGQAVEPAPSEGVEAAQNHADPALSRGAQTIEQTPLETSPTVSSASQGVQVPSAGAATEPAAPNGGIGAVGAEKPAESVREPQNPSVSPMIAYAEPVQSFLGALLAKANAALRGRKQKKLDKILALTAAKKTISNNDVELYLRVSHNTASRYLADLVKSSKLRVIGNPHQPKYELAE